MKEGERKTPPTRPGLWEQAGGTPAVLEQGGAGPMPGECWRVLGGGSGGRGAFPRAAWMWREMLALTSPQGT